MKCPWQTKTTIIPAIYHPVEMARHEQHIIEFAECIKEECPFWTAIESKAHRQEGGYKTFVRYKCTREVHGLIGTVAEVRQNNEKIYTQKDDPCRDEDGMKYYSCIDVPYWQLSEMTLGKLPELEESLQAAYQRGLNEAWDCARKIIALRGNNKPLFAMFGEHGVLDIINHNTAQEAIKKMVEYEKQKDAIKIGDELEQITNSGNPTGVSCVVTNIGDDKFNGIAKDGKAVVCTSQIYRWWRKTGRTFPQIAEVMKAMQEGMES